MNKISIVTINLNNSAGLKKTIKSVIDQTTQDYEFIIIDGGSTDDSINIIKNYANKITYWISEPDRGIYNAMNKGIRQATGEYCFFLNSGDSLLNVQSLKLLINNAIRADIVYFSIETKNGVIEYPNDLKFSFFVKGTISHQATIIKRQLLIDYNYYNEALTYASDWELFCKAFIDGRTFKKIKEVITFYDLNGISAQNQDKIKLERRNVLKNMIPAFYRDYIELNFYKTSKVIKLVKKILQSKAYKRIRKPKYN